MERRAEMTRHESPASVGLLVCAKLLPTLREFVEEQAPAVVRLASPKVCLDPVQRRRRGRLADLQRNSPEVRAAHWHHPDRGSVDIHVRYAHIECHAQEPAFVNVSSRPWR